MLTIRISDHMKSETTPITLAGVGATPSAPLNDACSAYKGLVPRSPKTIPSAARDSARVCRGSVAVRGACVMFMSVFMSGAVFTIAISSRASSTRVLRWCGKRVRHACHGRGKKLGVAEFVRDWGAAFTGLVGEYDFLACCCD